MKRKFLAVLIIPALMLTSCDFLFGVNAIEKEINVYDIDRLDEEGNLSSGLQGSVKAKFISGKELIPYLSLRQYASLYEKHFAEGVTSVVEDQSFSSTWTIKKNDEYYFICQASYLTGEFYMAGSIEAAYASDDDPRDLEALNYGLETKTESVSLSENGYMTIPFSGYGITHFSYGKEHYYPLGLLDITFSNNSSLYFTYNYSHIISTRDVDNYEKVSYIDNGESYTFDSQMEASKPAGDIPNYLRDYNARLFIYLMDHFYGLKEYKGYKSFSKYLKNYGIYNNLFVTDPVTRTWAYSDGLAILDDNHTGLISVNKAWGNPTYVATRRYGEECYKRARMEKELSEKRKSVYDRAVKTVESDIFYSEDGKTALFSFDSFEFGTKDQVFNEDKTIKETAKDYDTFFKLIDAFERIKAKGTVENVVLDIALNGGGYVGIMLKLIGLVSKDNSSHMAFFDDSTNSATIYSSQIDSNGDKKYDTDDCYGDDFNIYLLTSDCSFSCGNAFPCIAQMKNGVKIIGQKSGGGECVVAVHYLPNSEYVYHSSNIHIGLFDGQNMTFKGFESGATPDIEITDTNNFYNIEYLNTAITASGK